MIPIGGVRTLERRLAQARLIGDELGEDVPFLSLERLEKKGFLCVLFPMKDESLSDNLANFYSSQLLLPLRI